MVEFKMSQLNRDLMLARCLAMDLYVPSQRVQGSVRLRQWPLRTCRGGAAAIQRARREEEIASARLYYDEH